ncbi:MAG: type VI secretion system protein, partial [Myxococcota bacterium]
RPPRAPPMSTFQLEFEAFLTTVKAAVPNHPDGIYALPFYLVAGEPQTGRTAAMKSMNHIEGPIPMPPSAQNTYYIAPKATFIEPGRNVVGHTAQPGLFTELCLLLKERRVREPLDGVLLVISAARLADAPSEEAIEAYGKALRRQVVDLNNHVEADVPVYMILTQVEDLWGFGDAFAWGPHRRDEEPWGFSLPLGHRVDNQAELLRQNLEGLTARLESMCFAKLSSEDAWDERARAFQHLTEVRDVMHRLGDLLAVLSMGSAFETAPWLRSLILGSGAPGSGQRLRHGAARFVQMGLHPPPQSGTRQPGGIPFHAFLDYVLLPERDIVPTKVRWRDDKVFLIVVVTAAVLWLLVVVVSVAR